MENKKRIGILIGFLIGTFGVVFFGAMRPQMQLQALAQETCKELEGKIMLQAAPILINSAKKAEDLGYSHHQLGEVMEETCPNIIYQLQEFSKKHSTK